MAHDLDDLNAAGLFHGLHLSGSGEHWSAQMRAKELPSVSGKPMYRSFSAESPLAAIAKAVAAIQAESTPTPPNDDLI